MQPTIEDGELITVAPVAPESVRRGDILLYQNERGVFAHRVVARVKGTVPLLQGDCPHFLLRGDASFSCDPPVAREQDIGREVAVQRGNRRLALDSRLANLLRLLRLWISKSRAFRLLHLNYQKRIKKT
jgi:signal peptidase I